MRYLLDTTVLVDYLRDRPVANRVDALLDSGETLCSSAVNVEEVVRGLRSGEESAARQLMTGLLILPLGAEEGWRAGHWRRQYASRGITLSQPDCLVAAVAVAAGATLATGNPRHFPMEGVRVEEWPVGG